MVSPSVVVGISGSQATRTQLTPVAWDPFAPAVVVTWNPHSRIARRRWLAGRSRGIDIASGFEGGQEQQQAER